MLPCLADNFTDKAVIDGPKRFNWLPVSGHPGPTYANRLSVLIDDPQHALYLATGIQSPLIFSSAV